MNYSLIISEVADIIKFCFPVSFILGLSGKLYRLAIDLMFNKKVDI